ncbi:hypothetical protein KGG93_gp62 [Streptomyces phage Endor2]|uniref:DUF7417 domain-containing protein n=1 Tax=Streptomyces phage Endor2 TaxID=2740182 RepID=A0A7G4AX67_9CAUD|nr:hypothetical protein KGG93_gp62 [Streptomyces phage Endor2]QMP84607.1 hypothetical protein HUN44_00062 [Streptomyces phage Endor2]
MGSLVIEILDYEQGNLDDAETLELFGKLVKSGMAWTLQGHYGRVAMDMIQSGYLTEGGEVTELAEFELDLV